MKTARITLKHCKDLLDRHYSEVPPPDPEECASGEMTPEALKEILKKADGSIRFKVSYDPGDDEQDETWDLVGPGLAWGNIWFLNREDAERARDSVNNILREHFGLSQRNALLTPEAHLNRVVLDAPCCPACGSSDINAGEKELKGPSYLVFRDCEDCNAEWREVYALQGYRELIS